MKPLKKYTRLIEQALKERLELFPIVQIVGPRQSGKTTLVRTLENNDNYSYFDLQLDKNRKLLMDDPLAFLDANTRIIIDESQIFPELTSTLLSVVDGRDSEPGQYILTGSFDITRSPRSGDSLTGRICTLELLPLAQAEIHTIKPVFLDEVFKDKIKFKLQDIPNETTIIDMMLTGGYPNLLRYESHRQRKIWLDRYITSLKSPDIDSFAQTRKDYDIAEHLYGFSGFATQKLNLATLANELQINRLTIERRIDLYSALHIFKMLPRYRKLSFSKPSEAQLQFFDSGLFALLRNLNINVLKKDRTRLGPLLETFVFGELAKLCNTHYEQHRLYHWRKESKCEVDFVIENPDRSIVGIEVKSSRTILAAKEFKGLKALKEYCGDRMKNGIVLYLGDRQINMGNGMYQIPISSLWEGDEFLPLVDN